MSRFDFARVDVGFLRHPKTIRAVRDAGGDAIWLWLGVLCWMQEHNGEPVPDDCIENVDGPKRSRARGKALQALLKHGLVDREDGGFAIHDYEHWAPDEGAHTVRTYERDRKRAQRKAAREERKRRDSESGTSANSVPDTSPTSVPDTSGTGVQDYVPSRPRATPARDARATRTRDPREDQDQDQDQDQRGDVPESEPLERLFASPQQRLDVQQVWGSWRQTFNKPNAKLDHGRADAIARRIDAGATLQQIDAAFRGAKLDDWLPRKGFQLSLILSDQERFEHLVDLGTRGAKPPRKGPAPVQPNHTEATGFEGAERC